MACGMYRRIRFNTTPLKMYGFKKVSTEELNEITERIVRPTYNCALYEEEHNHNHSATQTRHRSDSRLAHPRVPSARCKKGDVVTEHPRTRLPAPLVDKIVKRMRTPTLSLRAAHGETLPSYEVEPLTYKPRPKSGKEKNKQDGYNRPTTASKSRSFCRFCTDPTLKEYIDVDYSEGKEVEDEELSAIVQRLTTPTMASRLQSAPPPNVKETENTSAAKIVMVRCPRRKQSNASLADGADERPRSSKRRPLICGLNRSRNVDEISNRLYSTPTHVIPTAASAKEERRQRLAATPCTM